MINSITVVIISTSNINIIITNIITINIDTVLFSCGTEQESWEMEPVCAIVSAGTFSGVREDVPVDKKDGLGV